MEVDIRTSLRRLGTDEVDHFGRPLTEHLVETSRWLEKWGNPTAISLAGAFHSIYGTEEFRQKTLPLDRRDDVRAQIGEEAEALVYLFCLADRHSLFSQTNTGPFEIPLPSLGQSTEVAADCDCVPIGVTPSSETMPFCLSRSRLYDAAPSSNNAHLQGMDAIAVRASR